MQLVQMYSYLETEAIIEGKVESITITVFTDANGNKYYNNTLPNKKIKKDVLVSSEPVSSKEALGTPTVNTSIEPNISQAKLQVNKNLQRNIKEDLDNDQRNETKRNY